MTRKATFYQPQRRGGSALALWQLHLSAPFMPAGPNDAGDNRRHCPDNAGRYRLAQDGADIETSQGWDQDLENSCADNAAYCSGDRISGA
jgi:hypothetical protein